MDTDSEADLKGLGVRVERARIKRGLSKEAAAREAGISSITWKRVEDGLPVQDAKLEQVLRVVGLDVSGHPARDVEGMSSWLSDGHRALAEDGDADQAAALMERILGTFQAVEMSLKLGVDIESATQLLSAALDVGLSSGVFARLHAVDPETFEEVMSGYRSLNRKIQELRRKGEVGRSSYLRTFTERARREGRVDMARLMAEQLNAQGLPMEDVARSLIAFFTLDELEETGNRELEVVTRRLLGLPAGFRGPRLGEGSGDLAFEELVRATAGWAPFDAVPESRKTPDVADSSTSYWESERSTGNVEADLPLASRKGSSKGRQVRAEQDAAGEENQDKGTSDPA